MKTFSINKISIAAFAVLFSVILYSCQKENQSNTSLAVTDEQAATYSDESTQAEASFDDVEDVSMTAATEESIATAPNGRVSETGRLIPVFAELRLRIGSCATITVTPNDSTYPKTITIDFGDGCLCADGKFRKGAIILELTGPIRRSGSVLTITFRDFYLNHAHIEGTKTVTNLSANGNIKFTVMVNDGKVTFPNGRGYKYESLRYVSQIEGGSTDTIRDDVYSIEGRSKTVFNSGLTIELNTETPLIKKVACHWISDGILKIKINDRELFLDYGSPNNGDCDNKALLTWNAGANTRLIILP
ncbi:MAG: hypothetical protein JJE22_12290 [Bacteroidia bacterium]|nr:hypothetical protein [Bacteroidia bacterium]